MKPELQIKALAELDGFVKHPKWDYYYRNGDINGKFLEDSKDFEQFYYLTSYDAIIPLIQKQDSSVQSIVYRRLSELFLWEYTPAQLAEALLRATGKWIA